MEMDIGGPSTVCRVRGWCRVCRLCRPCRAHCTEYSSTHSAQLRLAVCAMCVGTLRMCAVRAALVPCYMGTFWNVAAHFFTLA